MEKVVFVFTEAGGGHKAAVQAVTEVIQNRRLPWEIHTAKLEQVLFSVDFSRRIIGVPIHDMYNRMLRAGLTLGIEELLRVGQSLIQSWHPMLVELMQAYWSDVRPSIVVSFVPNFNRALRESLARVNPSAPYIGVITDLADFPPHFWMERQDQYLVCPTPHAVEQASAMGYPRWKVRLNPGVVLNPAFSTRGPFDVGLEREKLGLAASKPTGLVFFGGQGSRIMKRIAAGLDRSTLDIQLILLCGHNEKLASELRARIRRRMLMHVEGFTTEVPFWMRLSDFFIGKPGPGSVSEALAMKLPLIVERNAWTLPQERYNAEWITENGFGIVVRSFRRIVDAVGRLIEPESFARFKTAVGGVENRAVYETVDFLEEIAGGRVGPPGAPPPRPQSRSEPPSAAPMSEPGAAQTP